MVHHSVSLPSLQWSGKSFVEIVLCIVLMINACAASYLRETTSIERELQSLPTLDDIILTDPDLTTMAAAFKTAGLVGRLCTICNFTAFAPTNEAFDDVDQKFLTTLLTPSWMLHLQNLIAFHITLPTDDGNRLLSTDFVDEQTFEMLNSEQITASVLQRGINLTSPLTVGAMVIENDILASNGAVQKVDTVLTPGFFGVDVFALGDSYEEFTILQELIDLLGLAGTEGEFTILAPTNEAFLALGNETLESLKEDKGALGKILANHVIVGVFPSTILENGLVLESFGGFNISLVVSKPMALSVASVIMFNDASAILTDILAKNGIVHAIDMVLIDPDPMSDVPSQMPSDVPSEMPSDTPSSVPSSVPSDSLSDAPSAFPSDSLSSFPSETLSDSPSDVPSAEPSQVPSDTPSNVPSSVPSNVLSDVPSGAPSSVPSDSPSDAPSDIPSASPSVSPSSAPSSSPTNKKGIKKAFKGKVKSNDKKSEKEVKSKDNKKLEKGR